VLNLLEYRRPLPAMEAEAFGSDSNSDDLELGPAHDPYAHLGAQVLEHCGIFSDLEKLAPALHA
jgi:hypothetical protein